MKLKTLFSSFAMAATCACAQTPTGSGIDRANLDLSAHPGADFFTYATGGWNQRHPLTSEYARYGQFEALGEANMLKVRSLIEELATRPSERGSLEQKIGTLYSLVTDSARRNREDFDPIRPLLAEVEQITTRSDVQYCMARLSARGVSNFVALGCDADLQNAEWNLVQVNQSGLSMGNCDYYLKTDSAAEALRNTYADYVRSLFAMTGHTEAEAAARAEAVLRIEMQIARVSYAPVKLRDVGANYHKLSYRELLATYPGIDWSTLFMQNGMPPFDSLSVNQPEPIHEVERILAEADLADLKSYLYFKVVNDAASLLSDRFRQAHFNFFRRAMSGTEQDLPRWKQGVNAVESALGMALGRTYVERYFPASSKERMLQLVENLRKALGERIDMQTWMSDETKRKAHEKLDAFYVKIGYPDEWMDYSALDIDPSLSYYENMVRAQQFMSKYYIDKRVNRRTDRTEWLMTPQTINAYYNPTTNEICFPAGILQPPFFNAEADDACNYGAIGVVIGHEMTHGFDDQGSQFDKNGNWANWWTKSDADNFKARTQVMVDYFNRIDVLPDLKANGQLTLGENIADHGGIKIAFHALQNAMRQNPLPAKDGFTPEQRFFLSYALLWAGNIRPAALRQRTLTDPHSAGRWRVNGALPHIEAWYKAFGVKKSDPMYIAPKKRADVW